ncbi:MAG: NAD-dependent epimerase/dehydratase family protein [Bacteroidales bacterium]|jgi:nucleoside-diphosphate-sugar epimerase|nr:NAD-dependent epimerase/dehydratase family protein [Bacteroidales bacterium]
MKVAITGSRGFVGKVLVQELLKQNVQIIEIDFETGYDLLDWESLGKIEPFDALVHLAAKSFVPDSFKNPASFYENNIVGTLNALELCRKHKAKMIYTSSYVYGTPEYLPIDEIHTTVAFNPYAQSKLIGEDLCKAYNRDFGIPIVVLRPFNIFGKGQSNNFLIPLIINQASQGKVYLKDSRPKRDFIFIDDVVNAYVKSINIDITNFEVFNIGSGKSTSIAELVAIISKHYKTPIDISFSEEQRKNEVLDTIANISKAKELLNWEPTVSLFDGITKILDSYVDL